MAAPSVSINVLPFSTRNITIGQNITVQCAIATNYGRPTDIGVIPHILWDICYESDSEIIRDSFEASQLSNLTSAVFLSSLEYRPILLPRNFTCRSYVEPAGLGAGVLVRSSEHGSNTRSIGLQGTYVYIVLTSSCIK